MIRPSLSRLIFAFLQNKVKAAPSFNDHPTHFWLQQNHLKDHVCNLSTPCTVTGTPFNARHRQGLTSLPRSCLRNWIQFFHKCILVKKPLFLSSLLCSVNSDYSSQPANRLHLKPSVHIYFWTCCSVTEAYDWNTLQNSQVEEHLGYWKSTTIYVIILLHIWTLFNNLSVSSAETTRYRMTKKQLYCLFLKLNLVVFHSLLIKSLQISALSIFEMLSREYGTQRPSCHFEVARDLTASAQPCSALNLCSALQLSQIWSRSFPSSQISVSRS